MTLQSHASRLPVLSSLMHERRAVRTYDPTYRLSREEIKAILSDAIQAPSGVNLQSWRFLVIDDQPLKEKLLPIAFNQKQVKGVCRHRRSWRFGELQKNRNHL